MQNSPPQTLLRLGVIVLQNDASLEIEFPQALNNSGAVCHYSRITSPPEINPQSLLEMKTALPQAIAMLPPFIEFSAIAYACTSGATTIGSDNVAKMITSKFPKTKYTDPLIASIAAFKKLNLTKIAYLSPYTHKVAENMRQTFQNNQISITNSHDFNQAQEAKVANISEDSVLEATCQLGNDPACQAVFISCTNLKSLNVIKKAEDTIKKPVISSNQALLWHMLKLSKSNHKPQNYGSLLASI